MFAKKAMLATAAIFALIMSSLVATSSAQDGNDPAPPPLNGTTVIPGSGVWPDLVFLQMTFANSPSSSCTGTVVDEWWVLSAAHCVETIDGEFATEIDMLIGSVDVADDILLDAQGNFLLSPSAPAIVELRSSAGYIIKGDYNGVSLSNDVVLIKLNAPSAVPPRQIATSDSLVNPSNGSHVDAKAFGYGQICASGSCVSLGGGNFSSTDFMLREGDTEIISDADAEDFLGGLSSDLPATTFFTRPDITVHGALCFGDSGGPTMVMEDGVWKVAGVNSHIYTIPGSCSPLPGDGNVYINGLADVTSNAEIASWVQQIITAAARNCLGLLTTLVGSTFDDKMIGTSAADSMHGDRGFDLMVGREGGDHLCGGKAGDTILGGPGNDQIIGHSGKDDISGNSGADNIQGGSAGDDISGGSGNDVIEGGTGPDDISGNGGADDISGNGGDDVISGGKSGDDISGGKGDDTIRGNSGKDDINGNSGNDDIHGGSAADDINGGSGTDDCNGGTGADDITNCE